MRSLMTRENLLQLLSAPGKTLEHHAGARTMR
jgi:hypothetical protein